MRCEFCGCEMPADHRFCRHCGRPLKEDPCCAACGAAIPPDGQFCPVCGTPVKSPAPKKDRTAAIVVLAAALLVVILVVLIVLVLVSKPKPEPTASQPEEIVEPADPPETSLSDSAAQVLYLDVYDPDQNYLGCASGFLVNDDTTLVTNYHVIEDAAYVLAFRDQSKHGVRAETLLAADEDADLAVLRCEESPRVQPLTLTDSDTVKQGDTVYAAGYPLGVANTLSNGILSSRYTDELGVDTLQHTAPISEGSSGGALLNELGQVIGVTCATYVDGQNMNLAIAANVLAELLEEAPLDLPLYTPCTHEYGPWETVKEATCTEEGEMITHCTLCDEPMTRTTSPAPHTFSTTETTPATCEKEGKEVQTCEICGQTVTKTLPATGHDYANGFCTVCKKSDGTTPLPQQTPSGSVSATTGPTATSPTGETTIRLNEWCKFMTPGETLTLIPTTVPASAATSIVWSCDARSGGVTVENGIVTVLNTGEGKVYVTATTADGATAGCTIYTVKPSSPVISSDKGLVYARIPDILSLDNIITDRSEIGFWFESYFDYTDTYSFTYITKSIDTAEKYEYLYNQYLYENGCENLPYNITVRVDDHLHIPAIHIWIEPLS